MLDDKLKNNRDQADSKKAWWQPAVMIFIRFSAWIFAPVIAAAFFGKWLDKKYETEPILFLSLVGLAFLISIFGLVKSVKEEYRKIEENNQNTKNSIPQCCAGPNKFNPPAGG